MTPPYLLSDSFATIVRFAPLVSIDIVIRDGDSNALVGLRLNEPAKDHYFVPGGVIRKNEEISAAFTRILSCETGLPFSLRDAGFVGVFEHFYATNRFENPDFGTHYVVLAYGLTVEERQPVKPDFQHRHLRWMPIGAVLSAPDVHPYTKAYFR